MVRLSSSSFFYATLFVMELDVKEKILVNDKIKASIRKNKYASQALY